MKIAIIFLLLLCLFFPAILSAEDRTQTVWSPQIGDKFEYREIDRSSGRDFSWHSQSPQRRQAFSARKTADIFAVSGFQARDYLVSWPEDRQRSDGTWGKNDILGWLVIPNERRVVREVAAENEDFTIPEGINSGRQGKCYQILEKTYIDYQVLMDNGNTLKLGSEVLYQLEYRKMDTGAWFKVERWFEIEEDDSNPPGDTLTKILSYGGKQPNQRQTNYLAVDLNQGELSYFRALKAEQSPDEIGGQAPVSAQETIVTPSGMEFSCLKVDLVQANFWLDDKTRCLIKSEQPRRQRILTSWNLGGDTPPPPPAPEPSLYITDLSLNEFTFFIPSQPAAIVPVSGKVTLENKQDDSGECWLETVLFNPQTKEEVFPDSRRKVTLGPGGKDVFSGRIYGIKKENLAGLYLVRGITWHDELKTKNRFNNKLDSKPIEIFIQPEIVEFDLDNYKPFQGERVKAHYKLSTTDYDHYLRLELTIQKGEERQIIYQQETDYHPWQKEHLPKEGDFEFIVPDDPAWAGSCDLELWLRCQPPGEGQELIYPYGDKLDSKHVRLNIQTNEAPQLLNPVFTPESGLPDEDFMLVVDYKDDQDYFPDKIYLSFAAAGGAWELKPNQDSANEGLVRYQGTINLARSFGRNHVERRYYFPLLTARDGFGKLAVTPHLAKLQIMPEAQIEEEIVEEPEPVSEKEEAPVPALTKAQVQILAEDGQVLYGAAAGSKKLDIQQDEKARITLTLPAEGYALVTIGEQTWQSKKPLAVGEEYAVDWSGKINDQDPAEEQAHTISMQGLYTKTGKRSVPVEQNVTVTNKRYYERTVNKHEHREAFDLPEKDWQIRLQESWSPGGVMSTGIMVSVKSDLDGGWRRRKDVVAVSFKLSRGDAETQVYLPERSQRGLSGDLPEDFVLPLATLEGYARESSGTEGSVRVTIIVSYKGREALSEHAFGGYADASPKITVSLGTFGGEW